jgi:hypothetical protein
MAQMTDRPRAHAYSCRCSKCRSMAAAIGAQKPDGTYFFNDDELFGLGTANTPDPPDADLLPEEDDHAN